MSYMNNSFYVYCNCVNTFLYIFVFHQRIGSRFGLRKVLTAIKKGKLWPFSLFHKFVKFWKIRLLPRRLRLSSSCLSSSSSSFSLTPRAHGLCGHTGRERGEIPVPRGFVLFFLFSRPRRNRTRNI